MGCHTKVAGHLEVTSDLVSVRIGQRICREGKEEVRDSLLVECKEQDDESLAVEVVVFRADLGRACARRLAEVAAVRLKPGRGSAWVRSSVTPVTPSDMARVRARRRVQKRSTFAFFVRNIKDHSWGVALSNSNATA